MDSNCVVDFCNREKSNLSRNKTYCKHHELTYRRTGSVTGTVDLEFCIIEDCSARHHRYGYCLVHCTRFVRTGSALRPPPKSPYCSVEGCSRDRSTKGLCSTHYTRFSKTGDAGSAYIQTMVPKECAVVLCQKNGGLKSSSLCRQHRQMAKSYGVDENLYVVMANSACYVCKSTSSVMSIDHDHSCCSGRESCGDCVRGALCSRCNMVLGSIGDDVELLKAMVLYLG
jgi:hypothetical protein